MPVLAPYRGNPAAPSPDRPADVPLPPGRMPLVRDRRPLKRWRYVGVYGPELMLCAGRVAIGGLPQQFWAIWDREAAVLHERTSMRPGRVQLPDGLVAVRDGRVAIDLRLRVDGEAVENLSPHGASFIWTRKTIAAATGTVTIDGRVRRVTGRALVDDSAGYHARATDWAWSAGVGATVDGTALQWNLVTGIHDAPDVSERSVWVDGRPEPVAAVTFAEDLGSVGWADGSSLTFAGERERARHDRIAGGLLVSDYRQPFGTFTGTLPTGHELAAGFGVMERHHARW